MLSWDVTRRSIEIERCETPQISDSDLNRVLSFYEFNGRFLGGHRIVIKHLETVSPLWPPGIPITILDVRCGQGDLSRAISSWACSKKLDVQIVAIDPHVRIVHLAREKHRPELKIVYDVRSLIDPLYLQAQQFDYVVSSYGIQHENQEGVKTFLKTVNRLAKRGFAITGSLRDVRGLFWMKLLAGFFGNENVSHDAGMLIRRGFTVSELKELSRETGLDYARVKKHFGYRFSVAGERGLVVSPQMSRAIGLAGT